MKSVEIALGARGYPIHIGAGLLGQASLIAPHLADRQVMLVSDERTAPLYLERARAAFAGCELHLLLFPQGEAQKTLEGAARIFDALLEARCSRHCALAALGGGVVGDVTGFAAATYQRGVRFIQLPTTLLAQVDSSVGGKTGVNHPLGKNMIGAFHQPVCVIADTDALATLEERQLRSGIAEVIKYGLIRDRPFFDWLEENIERLCNRDPAALAWAIERCCENKAAVVAADEREAGQRMLLNLGHTFGHAIETAAGYGTWLHGEAVAAGMALAARLSARTGRLPIEEARRIVALIERAGLPTRGPQGLTPPEWLERMALDKKSRNGQIRLILLDGIGAATVVDAFKQSDLRAVLEEQE